VIRARRTSFVIALLLLTALRAATGGDPAPPDFAKSLARCKQLVAGESWAAGESALRQVFKDFPDDARVRARLREIEDQLKVCLFRKSLPPLKGPDLFGGAAKKFNASSRDVELWFERPDAPRWTKSHENLWLLDVRFEGALTFETSMSYLNADRGVSAVFLCYDIEKRGGYVILPGYYETTATGSLQATPELRKIVMTGETPIRTSAGSWGSYGVGSRFKAVRSSSDIVATVGGTVVARASDRSYTNGYLGVRTDRLWDVSIKGRLDKVWYRKTVAERYATQFAEWGEKTYDREKELPAWVRESVVAPPDMTLSELPSDVSARESSELRSLVEAALDGDEEDALECAQAALDAPPLAALYLTGVANLALGSEQAACDALDKLVAAEPDFVPGRMFRGIALFHLRRLPEAKADLAWALERRPRAEPALVIAAMLAIYEQDWDRAEAMLAKADSLGVSGEDVDEVRDWVHRSRTGPNFAQRYRKESANFVVVSDHSQQICQEAADLLESMQSQYAAALKPAPAGAPKARVYVFSGPEAYFDYAEDLHVAADSSSGVYVPMLRELCIWVPVDMTDFKDTVRHEGFHQYLHRLVDDAPTWFNEGWASVMGGGGPEGVRDAKRDAEFVKGFVPVRELVAMKHAEFMKDPGVTYTESRYLVEFLRRTKEPKLKNVLRDYFAAVASGLSQADANKKVIDPVLTELEAAFRSWR
jgi:tetratricopeptide (TPR) repeat protein